MKSSNNRQWFEAYWEKAFRNASKKPPDAVWDKINAELAGSEISGYKKRIVFFKWLAAASVLLAVGMGFYSLYYDRNNLNSESPVVQTNIADDTDKTDSKASTFQSEDNRKSRTEDLAGKEVLSQHDIALNATEMTKGNTGISDVPMNAELLSEKPNNTSSRYVAENDVAIAHNRNNRSDAYDQATMPGSHMTALPESIATIWVSSSMKKPDLPVDYMYKRPVVPVNFKNKKKKQPLQLYAGLNFSTGMFDPNFEGGSPESFNNADLAMFSSYSARTLNTVNVADDAVISNESYLPDISYSYGINMGARVAGRWVLRGGVSYIKANTIANTSAYYQDNSNNEKYPVLKSVNYQNDGVVEIRQTEGLQFDNTFEFASVPIKAGYIVLDKKLNLTLFGGVSSEFFLKNTITQKNDLTNVYENDRGSESPYRPVYFNGSLSTALGYTIAGHYRLSVEPGYRMALSSFTKDSFVLTGRPDAFYLNFGLSYWFK